MRAALPVLVLVAACHHPRPAHLVAAAAPATCDAATLEAFDPGLPGLERSIDEEPAPGALARSTRPCATDVTDDACLAAATSELARTDPDAELVHAAISGEPDGLDATFTVDGEPRFVRATSEREVADVARAWQAEGHAVVIQAATRTYRREGRNAELTYIPAGVGMVARPLVTLRWPRSANADVAAALARVQEQAAAARLSFDQWRVDDEWLEADLSCP